VGGACGTHGRGEKRVQGFGEKARRKKNHLKDQGVDGKMESKWTLGRSAGSGKGPLAACRECDDEPSDSGGMELVSYGM
jgi:hypothetical protein